MRTSPSPPFPNGGEGRGRGGGALHLSMWENIDRSMFKAIQTIQSNVPLIAYSFSRGTEELIKSIEFICSKLKTCKVDKRNKKPSTSQLLLRLKRIHYA